MPASPASFAPFLGADGARDMVALATRVGRYGMYVQQPPDVGLGVGMVQRHDAALQFLRTAGRSGRPTTLANFAARANTFRETYAYDRPVVDGIAPFLWNERFVAAAQALYGRPIVVPNIVYANVILPGQELGVHTDVPEFRGVNRKNVPEWFLVVMHHSGLFDRWRMPIATGVSWYHEAAGGDFFYYPDGPDGPEARIPARYDTAILLDTDSVFHGVDIVGSPDTDPAPMQPGAFLVHDGGDAWHVEQDGQVLQRLRWSDIRLSISWKAYCFADEAERRAVDEHTDDLSFPQVLDALTADMRRRGRVGDVLPEDPQFALAMIDEYVRFPQPPHAASAA
jgi:hypothetical protein